MMLKFSVGKSVSIHKNKEYLLILLTKKQESAMIQT